MQFTDAAIVLQINLSTKGVKSLKPGVKSESDHFGQTHKFMTRHCSYRTPGAFAFFMS